MAEICVMPTDLRSPAAIGPIELAARWARFAGTIERLAHCRSIDEVVEILRACTRHIVCADAIAIRSAPGEGTEVVLWLPVARKSYPQEAAPATPPVEMAVGRGELMLIEDDPLVRLGTADMLSELGFTVRELENAREGLDLIDGGYRPDIVVTDHIMPGMTGAEFALRLRADHPDIAILIMSGYQGIDLIAPDIVRLSKPFRQSHLRASIAAAFAQAKVEMEVL